MEMYRRNLAETLCDSKHPVAGKAFSFYHSFKKIFVLLQKRANKKGQSNVKRNICE
jgi:hypothetical protein